MAQTKGFSPKAKNFSRKTLLEILRDQYGEGGSGGQNNPPNVETRPAQLEEERRRNEALSKRLFEFKQQERLIFSAQEKRVELQIKAVREELRRLAHSIAKIDKEVEIATKLQPVEPGIYYLNFFEKLRTFIKEMAQRLDESATWLMAFNKRAKKQNFYWSQVKKSGTKFMLSQERYMATQVG
jgi:hypothetical protein